MFITKIIALKFAKKVVMKNSHEIICFDLRKKIVKSYIVNAVNLIFEFFHENYY